VTFSNVIFVTYNTYTISKDIKLAGSEKVTQLNEHIYDCERWKTSRNTFRACTSYTTPVFFNPFFEVELFATILTAHVTSRDVSVLLHKDKWAKP